jgi:CHAT domain-containing protein
VYDWFISPLQKEVKSHPRLIIARDAVCNFLPFEVLESGKKKQDYVANQAAIRYAYSATTLLNSTSFVQPRSSTLAVAPFESPLKSTATLGFQPLPASGEEARTIGNVTLLNQEATKARFLKEYPKHTDFFSDFGSLNSFFLATPS